MQAHNQMANSTVKSSALFKFYQSSIGQKLVMAVTGLMLIGFVVVHLLGNLQIFLGADAFNAYAAFLKSLPGPLWVARAVLLLAFLLHVITAFRLKKINKSARPVQYRENVNIQLDPASMYMLETGIVVLLFIVMHLAHFTFHALQPDYFSYDEQGRIDVYSIVIKGFQNGPYAVLYIISMIALGFHLRHAFWSMFQSVGLYIPSIGGVLKNASKVLALLVAFGYISIPLSVMLGIVK